jgi:hypothetical protein
MPCVSSAPSVCAIARGLLREASEADAVAAPWGRVVVDGASSSFAAAEE